MTDLSIHSLCGPYVFKSGVISWNVEWDNTNYLACLVLEYILTAVSGGWGLGDGDGVVLLANFHCNACRRCSNYIFILNLTHGFNGLGKNNCKTRRESSKFLQPPVAIDLPVGGILVLFVYNIVTHGKVSLMYKQYRKISNIRLTKSPNLIVSCLVLQLSLPNPKKPGAKSRMKRWLEQRRRVMLQLHLSDWQFYSLLRCFLY